MSGRRAGARQRAAEPLVELGERLHLARARPRAAGGSIGARLEAREALVDVVDEARLAHLAVVDHVDAQLDLLPDDLPDRLSEPRAIGPVVHAPSRRSRLDQLEKVGGTGQAAGMSGENAMRAALHGVSPGTRVYAEVAGSLRGNTSRKTGRVFHSGTGGV